MNQYISMVISVALAASVECTTAGPSRVEHVFDGVWLTRDDAGAWGGPSMGMTHQRGPSYQALKVLDLSGLAEADWQQVTRAALVVLLRARLFVARCQADQRSG